MEVAVHLRADAVGKFDLQSGVDAVSQMLQNVANEFGVELRPLSIKGSGPAQEKLRRLVMIRVPNEEIGLRIKPTQSWTIELTGRHWSNAGLKLPNHGQDFATLTFSVYPGLFGHATASN